MARRVLAALALLAAGGCATLNTNVHKQPTSALRPVADTPSTRYVKSETDAHPGESGFRLLVRNNNALMSRVVLADHAEHSIDLQYYIFADDATGRLLAQRLLAAADRGVRVRILLDDLGISRQQHLLDALDAHPNIDVRLFNPFSIRARSLLSKASQFLIEGRRLNRRMHNKSFIVDGMQAIIGGRNIGDAYFDVGNDVHFRDLDVTTIGPVVTEISSMFDTYWNSDAAYPIKAYRSAHATAADLANVRVRLAHDARAFAKSDYALALADELPYGPTADRNGRWFWGHAHLVADDPDKADPDLDGRALRIGPQVAEMFKDAHLEAMLVSPYFIPGKSGTRYLTSLAARGVAVKVLTNSLAATDEPGVHAGYSRYRRDLLEAGVDLYELRPEPGQRSTNAYGTSSGVSLHAKTMVVDHRLVFVGSMNLDPRSRLLNTEMGVIADCPPMAAAIEDFFAKATEPDNAFHVVLERPPGEPEARARMVWIASDHGKPVRFYRDPDVPALKALQVLLMRVLPVEGLL